MLLKGKDTVIDSYDFSEPPRECWLCGAEGAAEPLDRHHIFGGSYRKLSEKYKLVVYLCHYKCHLYGAFAAHNSGETMRALRKYGQSLFCEKGGTKEQFIKIFNHNFLD